MQLATVQLGGDAGRPASGDHVDRQDEGPLENPAIERIPDDPLLEPHPAEPGVKRDGGAAPLENPGEERSSS
jgi:hypothetical protein